MGKNYLPLKGNFYQKRNPFHKKREGKCTGHLPLQVCSFIFSQGTFPPLSESNPPFAADWLVLVDGAQISAEKEEMVEDEQNGKRRGELDIRLGPR